MAETAVVERLPKQTNQYPPVITKARQRQYLKVLAATGSHRKACEAVECVLNTPLQWANASKDFAKRWEAAKIVAEHVLLTQYESNLDEVLLPEKGMNIDDFARTQNSRFFRMKRLDPRYRDNAVVQVNAIGPTAIQLNFGSQAPQPVVNDSSDNA